MMNSSHILPADKKLAMSMARAMGRHLMSRCRETGRWTDTAVDTAITTIGADPILSAKDRLQTTDAASLKSCQSVWLSTKTTISHHSRPARA